MYIYICICVHYTYVTTRRSGAQTRGLRYQSGIFTFIVRGSMLAISPWLYIADRSEVSILCRVHGLVFLQFPKVVVCRGLKACPEYTGGKMGVSIQDSTDAILRNVHFGHRVRF